MWIGSSCRRGTGSTAARRPFVENRVLNRLLCHALLGVLAWMPSCGAASDEVTDRLTRQIETNRERYGIAGQAVEVTHNGRRLFRGVDGQADPESGQRVTADTIFPAYSVSKLFVSTLILQLVEQGRIELDRPASAYVTDLPKRWSAITVRQLLDHTSGLPEYFNDAQMAGTAQANASFQPSLRAVFAALTDTPLVFVADTDTRYTQTNYLVLSCLLEAHYGKPYPDIAVERIIDKLKLRHTYLGRDALPKRNIAAAYLGKSGQLQRQPTIAWPRYALSHAELYSSAGDLTTFLHAMARGELVAKTTLQHVWQPRTLSGGKRSGFSGGWEFGESSGYRQAGHDGGARVRVRILFKDTLDGDVFTAVYLTNGSSKNVWSRILLDSTLGAAAPLQFRAEALSERLIAFALQTPDDKAMQELAERLRADSGLDPQLLERTINNSGYAIRANLGLGASIPVFMLNTWLFPASANTWDSLAEAYEAGGDAAAAKAARQNATRPPDSVR